MLIFFSIPFFLVTAIFIFIFVKLIKQWSVNNKSPRLSVEATVVAKRNHISHSHHHHHHHHVHTFSSYYVTFQFESGDRIELYVPVTEYGLIIEGDRGILSFRGTRFLGFERKLDQNGVV